MEAKVPSPCRMEPTPTSEKAASQTASETLCSPWAKWKEKGKSQKCTRGPGVADPERHYGCEMVWLIQRKGILSSEMKLTPDGGLD